VSKKKLSIQLTASDQATLLANLHSNTTIFLGANIYLNSSGTVTGSATGIIIDNGQGNLVVDGMGVNKVDGQNTVRCFCMSGDGVNVELKNLEITNCNTVIPHKGQTFRF